MTNDQGNPKHEIQKKSASDRSAFHEQPLRAMLPTTASVVKLRILVGRDYFCRSPNRAKRMECVQLAAAFDCGRTFEWALTRRKRQQAARTPYASRGSVTDTNNRTRCLG